MQTLQTGDGILADSARWTFSGETFRSFDDHVSKSVPLYHEGHKLVEDLSDFFIQDDSIVYEIGCSTGTLLKRLGNKHTDRPEAQFIGIDIEPKMIAAARDKCVELKNVSFDIADFVTYDFKFSDFIVSYYSIQFIRPKLRQDVFNSIYKALNWGGAFLLFEKTRANDARFQDLMTQIYHEYKLDKDYTASEIFNKARSLKGILEPFSTQGNIDLLKRAGFVDITTISKYICFEGFLAIK